MFGILEGNSVLLSASTLLPFRELVNWSCHLSPSCPGTGSDLGPWLGVPVLCHRASFTDPPLSVCLDKHFQETYMKKVLPLVYLSR